MSKDNSKGPKDVKPVTDPKPVADPKPVDTEAAAEAEQAEQQAAALTTAMRSAKSSLRGARVETLVPHPVQPPGRKPDADMIASVRDVGVLSPIVVAKDGKTILSGHKRWQAAKLAGMENVPVVERGIDPNSPEAVAYVLAANVGNAPMTRGDRRTAIADMLGRGFKAGAIAKAIGAEKGTVDAVVSVLGRIPDALRDRYLGGEISDGDAKRWASWADKDPAGATVKAEEGAAAADAVPMNVADREAQVAAALVPEIPPEVAAKPGKTGRGASAKVRTAKAIDDAVTQALEAGDEQAAALLAWCRGYGAESIPGQGAVVEWCGDHADRLKLLAKARA